MHYPTRIIPKGDPAYPEALGDVGSTHALYVRGTLPAGRRAIAVVGTRTPSEPALEFTREIVAALAPHPIAIWSGGAYGIDAAAHRAAIEFGLPTVVVGGGGLGHVYPAEHGSLYEEVLAHGGALVARVPDEVPPMPPGFIARNSVLAALTEATVVIEAAFKSGARSTSAAARKRGRRVFVVPNAPWNPFGRGCAVELIRGGTPIICPADLLAGLGLPRAPASPETRASGLDAGPLDPDEEAILQVLDEAAVHLDLVAERAALPADRATAALLTLTIKAVVVEGPAGSYRRASSSLCLPLSRHT